MALVHSSAQLGQLMREARIARGLSQRELAALAGCSQRFLSELERGKNTAEIGKVFDVLEALGMLVDITSSRDAVTSLVARTEAQIVARSRPKTYLADYLETR